MRQESLGKEEDQKDDDVVVQSNINPICYLWACSGSNSENERGEGVARKVGESVKLRSAVPDDEGWT